MAQSWQDKQYNYHGSNRAYYSGCPISSGAAWSWIGFSGTNTGFGTHGNTESQRLCMASSGTSFVQWSYNSGTSIDGELYGSEALVFDGVNRSGVWIRTKTNTQKVRVWAW